MVELDACVRLNHTNTHADKQVGTAPDRRGECQDK